MFLLLPLYNVGLYLPVVAQRRLSSRKRPHSLELEPRWQKKEKEDKPIDSISIDDEKSEKKATDATIDSIEMKEDKQGQPTTEEPSALSSQDWSNL